MPTSIPEIIPSMTPSTIASDPAPSAKSGKAADAARQFEGLMIAQMLRDARESAKLDSGENEDGDDGGISSGQNSTMMDLADQQFAQLLAKQGGIGLGNLAAAGLKNAG